MSWRRSSQRFSFRSRFRVATRKLIGVLILTLEVSSMLANHQALGFAGIVDEDGFQLRKEVESFLGHLPFADAGGLAAAEGKLGFAADGGLIDVNHSRFDFLDEAHDRVDILRKDRSRKAVFNAVGKLQSLIEIIRRTNR